MPTGDTIPAAMAAVNRFLSGRLRYERLIKVVNNRISFLKKSRENLEDHILTWENAAKEASTPKLAEAFKHRANSYRLELVSLDDLSAFDDEIMQLLSELKTTAEILIKIRGVGMGRFPS